MECGYYDDDDDDDDDDDCTEFIEKYLTVMSLLGGLKMLNVYGIFYGTTIPKHVVMMKNIVQTSILCYYRKSFQQQIMVGKSCLGSEMVSVVDRTLWKNTDMMMVIVLAGCDYII